MAAYIDVSAPTGMTLFATIKRRSDGHFWKDSTKTFTTPYSKADHAISLTEGTTEFVGTYYSAAISNGSTALDAECVVSIHDDSVTNDVVLPGAVSRVVYRLGAETTFADLVTWIGSTPNALSSGNLPADVKLWLTGTPNALQSGRVDAYAGAIPSSVLQVDGSGYVKVSSGTGAGQLNFSSGVVQADAQKWAGQTIPTPSVTGVPKVDATHWLGSGVAHSPAGIPNVNVTHHLGTAAAVPTVAGVPKVETVSIGGTAVTSIVAGITTTYGAAFAHLDADVSSVGGDDAATIVSAWTATYGTAMAHLDADVSDAVAAADAATAAVGALNDPTVGAIADGVWDEVLSGHVVGGSAGVALAAAGAVSPPSATTIADAILTRNRSNTDGSNAAGTLGGLLAMQTTSLIVVDTMTVYESDGTTPEFTRTLTRATGNPKAVVGIS